MERHSEIKRTINYLNDIITDLSLTGTRTSRIPYSQLCQNYKEAQVYLQRFSASDQEIEALVAQLPNLLPGSIFNTQLEGMWLLAIPGCVIPIFGVFLVILTAPVSIPYCIIRVAVLRTTKSRILEAKFALRQIVHMLRERLVD
jgi:hypothetical protein